jgi:hypothetical protein
MENSYLFKLYMKYFIYNFLYFLIIIIFAYVNSLNDIENFTPNIRELYRPIIRNTRIISEGFYNKTTSNISNIFRKFGIM